MTSQEIEIISPGGRAVTHTFHGLPWDRQPGESQASHLLFLAYRNLGERRTITQLAVQHGESPRKFHKLSARWSWPERCRQWDNHQRAVEDKARSAVIRSTVKNHAEQAEYLLEVARRAITPPPSAPDPANWRPPASVLQAATIAFDKAVHHQRLALGLPTDITRQDMVVREKLSEANQVLGVLLNVLDSLCEDCRARVLSDLERARRDHESIAAAATG